MLKRIALALICTLLVNTFTFAGIGSREAAYVGGTVPGFAVGETTQI